MIDNNSMVIYQLRNYAASCPDPILITEPKTFASQNISGIFPTQAIIVEHGK